MATYHTSVLLHESIEALAIKSNGVYVDATMGGAGHTKAILSRLDAKGKLIVFDQDKDAWQNTPDDNRVQLVKENFRYLKRFLKYYGHTQVEGILADLGVSSFQFDTASRGFSIRYDAPLDMRMDGRLTVTAADIVSNYSEGKLHKLFEQYGEVRNAKTLANLIVNKRSNTEISTIAHFKQLISSCIKGVENKYLAQVFQALRIEVNEEMKALEEFLQQAVQCLKPGGRLCIITFHSLEDRMVKRFMKAGSLNDLETDEFGRRKTVPPFKMLKDIVPSEEEITNNNRSRSARLRIAEKL